MPTKLVLEDKNGKVVGERMTYEKLSPELPATAATRWRCNYCLVEGTQEALAKLECAAGAVHPPLNPHYRST